MPPVFTLSDDDDDDDNEYARRVAAEDAATRVAPIVLPTGDEPYIPGSVPICDICTARLHPNEVWSLGLCGHTGHRFCLEKWIEVN
jgi:hypothetical protein